ncbi:hypothetical protein TRFO_16754 [Tritrichomonas foetus]|uniref:Raptor N-terminal CASPase-like domain-containing protein n=1 Tax=Tritrichomonas foetus TaxID=1144522 RepID=A0A1J4KUM3_9EUKA|nr:hypothetical protein TRFO_16754 [Tritrichomonas foetus]|eukprot:OHT13197.1 hypothetical protein TRFO_16754 [Tritrichomonas foetus]
MNEEKRKIVYAKGQRRSIEPKPDVSPYSGREIDPKNHVQEPILNSWYYQTLGNGIPLPEKHPISYMLEHQTKVIKYFVTYVQSKKNHIDFNDESRSAICFWQNGDLNISERHDELTALIKSQFSSLIPQTSINVLLNQDFQTAYQQVMQVKRRTINLRMVFHYIGHEIDENIPDGLCFPNSGVLPLRDLLEHSGSLPIFIFDRDNSGSLLEVVKKYAEEKPFDAVMFFSCSEGEMMPRSTDYPVDLFTSCLTSPAKIALIWHSRHYFCFQSGCLQTLPTFFLNDLISNDDDKRRIDKLLNDLRLTLRSTVETIALENMDPLLFVKLFRTDSTLTELCINFILACRILNYFNIHPLSYPEFPDLNECSEWHTFDLRLDATLYLLKNKDDNSLLSYHKFLSQTLISMQNYINLSVDEKTSPFELSFFSEILNDKQLCNDACDVLAKYLDSSVDAVYYCLYFPIPKALFRMLTNSEQELSSSLLFSIMKILSYYRDARTTLLEQNCAVIEKILLPALKKGKNSHLIVILLALLTRESVSTTFKQMLSHPDELLKLDFDQYDSDSKMWLLRFISYSIQNINEYSLIIDILQPIVKLSEKADPELQITIICTLSGFIRSQTTMIKKLNSQSMKRRKIFEKKAVETAMTFSHSASYIVRRELLIMLRKYKETHSTKFEPSLDKQKPFYKSISIFLDQCAKDPNPLVRETYNNQNPSFIFDTYIAALLKPVYSLLTNTDSLSEDLRPQKTNDNSIRSPIRTKRDITITSKYSLKIGTYYRHNCPITSNLNPFINEPPEQKIKSDNNDFLLFGDKNGNVVMKSFDDSANIIKSLKVADTTITDVRYIKNYGYPLVFAATQSGNCFCSTLDSILSLNSSNPSNISNYVNSNYPNSYLSNNMNITSVYPTPALNSVKNENNFLSPIASFQLIPDLERPCQVRQAIDEWKMRLYSFAFHESSEFLVRDLRADRLLPSIKPKYGTTNTILISPRYEDIIAVGGDGFELYDVRVSCTEPQVFIHDKFEAPTFMIEAIDDVIPVYAYSSTSSGVAKIDIRHPEGMRTSYLYFLPDQTDQKAKAFAACNHQVKIEGNKALMTAISHAYGITCVDLENGKQESLPQVSKTGTKFANSSALIFRPKSYSLTFVHDDFYIVNAI